MTLLDGEALMKDGILALTDPTSASFSGFPANAADAAVNWGGIITTFFSEMTFPKVSSGVLALCEPLFVSTFLTQLEAGAGAAGFNLGLDAYVAELSLKVVAAGFATVCIPPPPGTLLLELTMNTNTADATAAAEKFAARILEWATDPLTGGKATAGMVSGPWS